jgi:Ni2+-binding GTPase involved in maturation of urease and hydrogenase
MLQNGLEQLPLSDFDLIIVENVGDLDLPGSLQTWHTC